MRYPWILMDSYQPVILPAVAGAVMLWRNRATLGDFALVPAVWTVLPVLALNFLSGRSPRYLVPLFPALALCGGFCLAQAMPGAARLFWRWIAPALVVIATIVLWTKPAVLRPLLQSAEDPNRDIKVSRSLLRQIIPADQPVALLGARYWGKAAPLLYYAERRLDLPATSVEDAVQRADRRPSRLLLCDLTRLGELDRMAVSYRIVFRSKDWVLLELGHS